MTGGRRSPVGSGAFGGARARPPLTPSWGRPGPAGGRVVARSAGGTDLLVQKLDILCPRTLGILHQVELHSLTL
jgi:hypothetical protein